MSRSTGTLLARVGCRTLLAMSALAAAGACAVPSAPPQVAEVPEQVKVIRAQIDRWSAAFGAWRSADPGPGEDAAQAARRRKSQLFVVPSPLPRFRAVRRADGDVLMINTGLMALVDQLLRAEGDSPECFGGYAARVQEAVQEQFRASSAESPPMSGGVPSPHAAGPQPLKSWPRLARYALTTQGGKACPKLRQRGAKEMALRAWVDDHTGTVALWVFAYTAGTLRADRRRTISGGAAPASGVPTEAAAPADRLAAETSCGIRLGLSAEPEPGQQAWLNICRSGLERRQTAEWLQTHIAPMMAASPPHMARSGKSPPLGR